MQHKLNFSQRDEFDAQLDCRDFSQDSRRLMQLMHGAANGSPGPGIEGKCTNRYGETMYVMVCSLGQDVIAERCGIKNDTAVRRACVELEQIGILRRITNTMPTGGKETSYFLSITRLMAIEPIDHDTAIGRALQLLAESNPFVEEMEPVPFGLPVGSPVGMPVVCRSHDNHHDDVLINNRTNDHDHDKEPPVSFSSIPEADIRLIAGFAVGGTTPTASERWNLFLRYWAEVQASEPNLTPSDQVELLALFLYWGRTKTNRSRGGAVTTWWRSRHTKPLRNTYTKMDLQDAQRLASATWSQAFATATKDQVVDVQQKMDPAEFRSRATNILPADSPFLKKLLKYPPVSI